MKLTLLLTAWLLACCAIGTAVHAQDPQQELLELRARIEALERQTNSVPQAPAATPNSQQDLLLFPPESAEQPPGETLLESHWSEWPTEAIPEPSDACAPATNAKSKDEDDPAIHAYWKHGLELATKDKAFRVHIGGRTQFDIGWFDADQNVQDNINFPYEDGVDFRRGRIRIDGTMYETMEWAVEYDFFNAIRVDDIDRAVTAPTDLWWTFKEVPWFGNIRVGNQKPAMGFEHLVSSRFLPFMERSYNQDTFYGGAFNGFWPGISAFDSYGADELGTWNTGLFKPTNNVFAASASDGDYAVFARTTRLLYYECDGESLLHIGGSVAQLSTVRDRTVLRTRDAIRTGLATSWPVPASTGPVVGDDMQWINGEVAAVYGPWTFQSEYLVSYLHDAAPILGNVVQSAVGTAMYQGGYAQLLYFLTGEHDNYNKGTGVFDRVIPHENFGWFRKCGAGAWQVGARYNYLDLNDDGLDGGILHNGTFGLNWFLNPNMKIQFDTMATHRDAPFVNDLGDGWIYGFGIRFAQDF